MDAIADAAGKDVVRWTDRDRNLEAKLRKLYLAHLRTWLASQGDKKFEQKWHVGRAMLDWFYAERLIDADEFEAVNAKIFPTKQARLQH